MFIKTILLISSLVGLSEQSCTDNNGNTVPCPLICQSTTDGTFLPSATSCSNKLSDSDCATLFPCTGTCTQPPTAVQGMTSATQPFARNMGCVSSSLTSIALQCAKQCGMCCQTPEVDCLDDTSGVIDCAANTYKCTDPSWTTIMAKYCPHTCKLCNSGTCKDNYSGCSTMSNLCKDVGSIDFMKTNCAKTCNYCTTCKDNANNCRENANLCTNAAYRQLMQQQCCATCSALSG